MGALTTGRGVGELQRYIADADTKGREILDGGKVVDRLAGYFFQPTIISGMTPLFSPPKKRSSGLF